MGVPYNFSVWETLSHDRDETLEYLDHYLSPKLDLVTVQLAENVSDLSTYEEDYESLLKYVKEKAPNARILVVDDFWSIDNRAELKKIAVDKTCTEFVSLEGITDNKEYYYGLGTIVYDAEGNEHVVEHSGVANHPGDKGMKAIAERIIEELSR
ncbi:MAG: SGNH/GDSL hydrolase family protein [Lachnospiraceae bacterium]|jgi:phage I-like protein|nr:SGNH/GDSL hydrolase family protein [Lachnospiraceae bacterium]